MVKDGHSLWDGLFMCVDVPRTVVGYGMVSLYEMVSCST